MRKIRIRMRDIARERRRLGYRSIDLMLERDGITMNHKKLRRLYREKGLAVKRRRGRKRATGTREPMALPSGPSKRWSLDFVADTFGASLRFRILAVIDDYTRECLALVADTSLSGGRVAAATLSSRASGLVHSPISVSRNTSRSGANSTFFRRFGNPCA